MEIAPLFLPSTITLFQDSLDSFKPKNLDDLKLLETLLNSIFLHTNLLIPIPKDMQRRVCKLKQMYEKDELILSKELTKKIDQVVFNVCFPTFFLEFSDDALDASFDAYDELVFFPIYFNELRPIRELHGYNSVRTLLKRNAVHCLDSETQAQCRKFLHQVLFFVLNDGALRKITLIPDKELRFALIQNAAGLIHLNNQGLNLDSILKMRRAEILRTLANWKHLCRIASIGFISLDPCFKDKKGAPGAITARAPNSSVKLEPLFL